MLSPTATGDNSCPNIVSRTKKQLQVQVLVVAPRASAVAVKGCLPLQRVATVAQMLSPGRKTFQGQVLVVATRASSVAVRCCARTNDKEQLPPVASRTQHTLDRCPFWGHRCRKGSVLRSERLSEPPPRAPVRAPLKAPPNCCLGSFAVRV